MKIVGGGDVRSPCCFTEQKVKNVGKVPSYEARQNVVSANPETKMP